MLGLKYLSSDPVNIFCFNRMMILFQCFMQECSKKIKNICNMNSVKSIILCSVLDEYRHLTRDSSWRFVIPSGITLHQTNTCIMFFTCSSTSSQWISVGFFALGMQNSHYAYNFYVCFLFLACIHYRRRCWWHKLLRAWIIELVSRVQISAARVWPHLEVMSFSRHSFTVKIEV